MPNHTESQLKIGLLGYGTVGRTVAALLDERDCGVEIRHILRRSGRADGPLMTDSFETVLNDPEVTCIVEALPGRDPALSYIRAALAAGKHVVTSNKAAVASDLKGLAELARARGVSLLFEASCGGGMHWIEMIKKTARFDEVTEVSGILNGTCNYILDHMEKSALSFEEALSRAQALGYAEADPTADVSGADVRNKAIISASLAYRTPVIGDIPTAGIAGITREIIAGARARGRSIRLMMLSQRQGGRYAAGIVPVLLPSDEIAANVRDNLNYGRITGDVVGALTIIGQGAGGRPTADAVIQDLISLGRGEAGLPVLDRSLTYDPDLLRGTGHFPDEVLPGRPLAELIGIARQKQSFLAFEPQATE